MASNPNSPPPQTYQRIYQPFFAAATEHKIEASGGSASDSFAVDSLYDFSVNSAIVHAYDQDGSLFDLGVRSDLFEMEIKSQTTGNSFQNKAFDIRAFRDLVISGTFPGMYLPKTSIWAVNVIHKPIATNAAPALPVVIKVQFFGSLRTIEPNPEYQRWLQQNQQYR